MFKSDLAFNNFHSEIASKFHKKKKIQSNSKQHWIKRSIFYIVYFIETIFSHKISRFYFVSCKRHQLYSNFTQNTEENYYN